MKKTSVNIEKSVSAGRGSVVGLAFLWIVITVTAVSICEIFTYALMLDFQRLPVYITAAAVTAAAVFAAKCFYRAPWNFILPIVITIAVIIFRKPTAAGFHNITNVMNAAFSGPLNITYTTAFICAAVSYIALMLTVCGGFMMNALLYLIICVPFMFVCVETWRINLPALMLVISCIWGMFAVNAMNKSAWRAKDVRTENEKTVNAGIVAFAAACILILSFAAVRVLIPPQSLLGMADLTKQKYPPSQELAESLADNIADALDIPEDVVNPPEYTDIPPDIDLSAFEIAGIPTPEITPEPTEEPTPEPTEEPTPEPEPESESEPESEPEPEPEQGSFMIYLLIAAVIAVIAALRGCSEKIRTALWRRLPTDKACMAVFKRTCRIMNHAGINPKYTTLTEWAAGTDLNCVPDLNTMADKCRKCAYSAHNLTAAEANEVIAAYNRARKEIKGRISIIKRIFIF